MLIGDRYSEKKLYSGLKYYDGLPLTSGDLHEYADLQQVKERLFTNNILGSGLLNKPTCRVTSTGVDLNDAAVIMLDGDVVAVKGDGAALANITTASPDDGIVCILGWYQFINANSVIKSYGGVSNTTLTNDLVDPNLHFQVSTRYQFRWMSIILDYNTYKNGGYTSSNPVNIPVLDESGNSKGSTAALVIPNNSDTVKVINKLSHMTYASSNLYLVPLIRYTKSNVSNTVNFSELRTVNPEKPKGATELINSTSEPTGDIEAGTVWYNPSTEVFKIYVEGLGFQSTLAGLSLIQYKNTISIISSTTGNILLDIGVESYREGDIVQVIYEGLLLTEGLHYEIDNTNNQIKLLNYTVTAGDHVTILVTKVIDASESETISEEFSLHANTTGCDTELGHLKLSDNVSDLLDVSEGVAATPKSVYDAVVLRDTVTGIKYKLAIVNRVIALEVVE